MRKLSQYVIVACLLALASVQCAHAAPPYSWPRNSVLPIYLVPTDWDINSAEVQAEKAALNDAMQEIQQFYARALGGNTFIRNELVLVQASQPKEAYGHPLDRWEHLCRRRHRRRRLRRQRGAGAVRPFTTRSISTMVRSMEAGCREMTFSRLRVRPA